MSDLSIGSNDQKRTTIHYDRDQLRELDASVVWHAFSQMSGYDGLIIDSAQGCWLTDIDGRRFFDGASSMWCNLHGHRHPYIDQAIRDQLEKVSHVTNLGMSHPTTIELARRLTALSPTHLKHVFFSSDGASAVEVAMKIAFQFWRQCPNPEPKRTLFLALGSAYHGDTIGTVSVGGVSRFHDLFSPLLFPVLRGPCPDSYRLPDGVDATEATDFYLAQYRALMEAHSSEIAAVVAEPIIQGAAGVVIQPPGFMAGLEKLCREFGCLFIADEIAVGMGRTGKMFACEHEGLQPDLLCIGKGLTGGYLPMSATLTSSKVWDAFLGSYEQGRSFQHGHTFGGNPLCAAAALATLDLFQKEQTLEKMPAKVGYMRDRLNEVREHADVGDVRQFGMLAAIDLVTDKETKQPHPWQEQLAGKYCKRFLDKGLWLRPLGNVIPIIPPLSSSMEELQFLTETVIEGLKAV
jgi:adenosylmethionine-8-amino-7-oxononanoate aminotransferase